MGKASRRKRERQYYQKSNYEGWLWCLHCERFFQSKDLSPDSVGGNQGCAFIEECGGAGFGVDIFPWDDWPKQNPDLWAHWPKSESELSHGLLCPLYV